MAPLFEYKKRPSTISLWLWPLWCLLLKITLNKFHCVSLAPLFSDFYTPDIPYINSEVPSPTHTPSCNHINQLFFLITHIHQLNTGIILNTDQVDLWALSSIHHTSLGLTPCSSLLLNFLLWFLYASMLWSSFVSTINSVTPCPAVQQILSSSGWFIASGAFLQSYSVSLIHCILKLLRLRSSFVDSVVPQIFSTSGWFIAYIPCF